MTALREGRFLPGDRLREEEVGALLSLSRTPVREALRRLEAEGLVEHRPRIGAVIRKLEHTEIVQLYEMRMVLERTAAELAAKHGSSAEFDTLDALNAEILSERNDPAKAASINQTFHRTLYLAGRNRFLLDAARAVNHSLLLLGPTTYYDQDRIDAVLSQHSDIVEALRAGDAALAGEAAEVHLQASLRYRLKAISA